MYNIERTDNERIGTAAYWGFTQGILACKTEASLSPQEVFPVLLKFFHQPFLPIKHGSLASF